MAASTTTGNFKVIGTRPIRHDGVDKVTGRAKYGADYAFPGMLHGKVLRSPHAHANIKSINIDKALKLPGVKAIVTGNDLPKAENKLEQAGEMVINPMYLSMNILAQDKVLYDGHAIAAVAATSPHIAEEALRLIEVEYEVLPPVMTVDVATRPGAPILLKDLRNKEEGDKPTNLVPAESGGGSGAKPPISLEPLSVLLSKKTGAPVKLVMSRSEVLRASGPTSGSKIKVKIGATKDGKLVAAEIWMAYEAGAFPGSPVGAGAMCIIAPYTIENFVIDAYDVVVNPPKPAAYRAPGATNAAFASETIIDELAEKCGIDPIDFRLKNAVKEGDAQIVGPAFKRIGMIQTLEGIKNSPHHKSKLTGKFRGRGVASGFWFNAGMQSSATVNIHADGTASVVTGSPDIGGSRASMAMITAEVLGLAVTDVRPITADTDSIGHTDVTGGSRVTFATGMAVYEAAKDAERQLIERAAKLWEKKPDEVEFRDGKLHAKGNGVPPMSIKQLAPRFGRTGGPITGRASVNARGVGPGFATTLVDVEVDPDTGKVQILRCTIAQDAGKAIHPSYVEGQMQGGTAQGLGWALNEEYFYDDKGTLRNFGFLDYRMPTCLDLPMIETVIVEEANPGHPLGVRGVGEVSIVPPPAAVANAIYRAVGVRMTETPMSPPKLLKAMLKHRGSTQHSAAAD